ncbi:MAG TPA: biopolymer transporter ExbD [Candidatus Binataceae bacterium]|nr:biopolymer transporter ExbD [Candidatus Binataceae bacterium]
MAIQAGNEQGGIFASINITPLTDIFLVLLIIFMVATAVTIESAAHVDLPKLQSSATTEPKGVTVTYTATHQILINQKPVSEADFVPVLKDALSHTTDKLVVFDGDRQVILGDMVRILDIAKGAGATQVALAVSTGSSPSSDYEEPAAAGVAPLPEPEEPGAEPVAPAQGGMP